MVENPHYGLNTKKSVRRILFNGPLKKLLLDYGQKLVKNSKNSKEIDLNEKTIAFADRTLRDFPGHDDHFHFILTKEKK